MADHTHVERAHVHRVVTYNLLSTALVDPAIYVHCEPQALNNAHRIPAVLALVRGWCSKQAVLCLQEVSRDWADALLPLFGEHHYMHAYASYGHEGNGYMGVLTAWPTGMYQLRAVNSARLTDTVQATFELEELDELCHVIDTNWPTRAANIGDVGACQALWLWFSRLVGWPADTSNSDTTLDLALKRKNCLLWTQLVHIASGTTLCVANYHMPCMYWNAPVMCMHAAMAAMVTRKLSGDTPYILAGDFNIKHFDAAYKLLLDGLVTSEHVHNLYLKPDNFMVHPHMSAMRSMSNVASGDSCYHFNNLAKNNGGPICGAEPQFTCWTHGPDAPAFKATLDYIWLSVDDQHVCQWRCTDTFLPECTSGPLPTLEQPSDHLPLEVVLLLK